MGPSKNQYRVIAEVSHQINSPLAAIRNALYLAAQHTEDGELLEYLAIADAEVTSIVSRIRDLREMLETGGNLDFVPAAPPLVQSLGKAA
jgi:signal transduction histidine kinase